MARVRLNQSCSAKYRRIPKQRRQQRITLVAEGGMFVTVTNAVCAAAYCRVNNSARNSAR